jgi:hypothetical protein
METADYIGTGAGEDIPLVSGASGLGATIQQTVSNIERKS